MYPTACPTSQISQMHFKLNMVQDQSPDNPSQIQLSSRTRCFHLPTSACWKCTSHICHLPLPQPYYLIHHQVPFTFKFQNLPQIPLHLSLVQAHIILDGRRGHEFGFQTHPSAASWLQILQKPSFPFHPVTRSKQAGLLTLPSTQQVYFSRAFTLRV